MFTDMVGFTALGQKNESLSLALVEEQRNLIRPTLKRHNGREVKTIGDAFLVEFPNALDAARCAFDIQRASREHNLSEPADRRIKLRVGLHLGDIEEVGGDIFGDAVNVASRIEPLAEEGGVCVTDQVRESIHNKFEVRLESLGTKFLKNVAEPVGVYKMVLPWNQMGIPLASYDKKRIAVLPFVSMSPDPADGYFADGLTEELISAMSRIGSLKVIARTSVMGYKGGQKKISDIAKELEVGSVLEGSVRKAGERARITVQLIDSGSSENLWAESYDRELRDIFAVQTEISITVANALKVRLTDQEKARIGRGGTVNPEAYTLYLKGRFYWNERTQGNINKAVKYFEEAVRADPEFALAYSGLADCYNVLADYFWMEPGRAIPLAREYSLKALRIDDSLAEAHASHGLTLFATWDFQAAEEELVRAIELRPNYGPAHHWYANLLNGIGRLDESYQEEKLGLEVDPNSRVIGMGFGGALHCLERYEESIEQFSRVIDLNPDFGAVHRWKSEPHLMLGQYETAIDEAKRAYELDKDRAAEGFLAFCYAVAGKTAEAQEILSRLLAGEPRGYVPPGRIAWVEFGLGRADEGFTWLERALAEKDNTLLNFMTDPVFKKYRRDPRWRRIEEKIGLPKAHWHKSPQES